LDSIIQSEVIERFDHKNLNLDCIEFKELNPTGENIISVIYRLLRKRLPEKFGLQLRLWETEKNYFEFPVE
jgi:6-pyruvoyltetrahydropterin/6-carboxytetrahydropterin synthase